MKLERLESLLWEKRDGFIAADELNELDRYLDEHPEARNLEKEIEILAERLDGLDQVVPPQVLKPRIREALAEVRPPAAANNPSAPSFAHRISRSRGVPWLPMAACLLIGIAVGYLSQTGSGPSVEPAKAAGAMSTSAAEPAPLPLKISLTAPSSSVEIGRIGDLAAIRINLESTTDLEIDLEAAEGFLLVTGIDADAAAAFDVNATAGRTVLRTRGPTSRTLEISATAGAIPVRLVVRENGIVVADRWLEKDPGSDRN